jgi:pimeloyl-ACP methyl ester carboxylesterase
MSAVIGGVVDLGVDVEGEGRPVVLLHGFPDRASLWREVTPSIVEAGHRAIAPDLRGFGRSPAPKGRTAYRIDLLVEDVVAMLDTLGVDEPVDLVGHDWGALLGWAVCLAHPERIRSYVALSVGHPRAYTRGGIRQKLKGTYVFAWQVPRLTEAWLSADGFRRFRSFERSHPDPDVFVEDMARPGRLTAGLNWYRANLVTAFTRRWARCRVPTLGVWGSEDRYLAEDQMRDSALVMDAAWRYRRLDGAGHWLPLERPREVADLILEWIDDPSRSPASRIAP